MPVYAIWGNHEDRDVVEQLFRRDIEIENLYVLHHRRAYKIGPVLVYGLGGNFLISSKLLHKPIAGGGGKIWSTLSQYADLIETVEKAAERSDLRIFVSHVSPGKEAFVELTEPGRGPISRSAGTWERQPAWSGTRLRSAPSQRRRIGFLKDSMPSGEHA